MGAIKVAFLLVTVYIAGCVNAVPVQTNIDSQFDVIGIAPYQTVISCEKKKAIAHCQATCLGMYNCVAFSTLDPPRGATSCCYLSRVGRVFGWAQYRNVYEVISRMSGYHCEHRNPCTSDNISKGEFYHQHFQSNKFVQCDAHGGCFTKRCKDALVWQQDIRACNWASSLDQ